MTYTIELQLSTPNPDPSWLLCKLIGISSLDGFAYICGLHKDCRHLALWKGSGLGGRLWDFVQETALISSSEMPEIESCDFYPAFNATGDRLGLSTFHISTSGEQRLTYFHVLDLCTGVWTRWSIDCHMYDLVHTNLGWLGCHFERRKRVFRTIDPNSDKNVTKELLSLSAEIYALGQDKIYFFQSSFSLRNVPWSVLCIVDLSVSQRLWSEYRPGTGFDQDQIAWDTIKRLIAENDRLFYVEERIGEMQKRHCVLYEISFDGAHYNRSLMGRFSLSAHGTASPPRRDLISGNRFMRLHREQGTLLLSTVFHSNPPSLKQLATVAVQKLFARQQKSPKTACVWWVDGISKDEFREKFGVWKSGLFA